MISLHTSSVVFLVSWVDGSNDDCAREDCAGCCVGLPWFSFLWP